MSISSIFIAAILLLLAISLKLLLHPSPKKSAPFPNGPPTVPILGNLHQIPLTKSFVAFAEWSRTYGSSSDGLVGLRLGPSARAVVLNKWQHARDLLDARGSIYSDRPHVPLVEYVVPPPGDLHLAFMPYGAKWRRARRTITDFLKESELEKLVPLQDAESTQMMWDLLVDADAGEGGEGSCHKHVMRCFGAVVLSSVFGIRNKTFGPDSQLKRFFETQDEWAAMLEQGATPPYDIFPFLRWIPDSMTPWKGWKKRAEVLKQRQSSLYRELFELARDRVNQGKSQECFVAGLLRGQEHEKEGGYTQDELDYIGGFLMEGGSDTTAMAFVTFILAMAAYPTLQREAQQEIDAVYGDGRIPSAVGIEDLPFLRACFMETLRWRPGFPMAIPHSTSQDDTYQGFFIPKRTTIIMNVWAMQHDRDEYAHPDVFDPSRYLDNRCGACHGDGDEPSRKQTYAFGAGRRMCAGQRMAESSMIMAMAKLLWTFDVVADGNELDTDVRTAFKDAVLTGPKGFGVEFRMRGDARREVLRREWEKADAFLRRYE